jgi:hypothetical protein
LLVKWAFLEKDAEVISLGDPKVTYSWTCGLGNDESHKHVIECLWIWHDCDANLELDPSREHWSDLYVGWKPSGVGLHDLISADPLHIEASIYWPSCCGMHGFIRDGKYIPV